MDINQVIIGNPTSVKFFYQSTGISVMNEKCGEVGYIFENGNNWNICNAVKIRRI